MIVFTRWGYDKKAINIRKGNKRDEEFMKENIQKNIEKFLKIESLDLKFAFIDNDYIWNPDVI